MDTKVHSAAMQAAEDVATLVEKVRLDLLTCVNVPDVQRRARVESARYRLTEAQLRLSAADRLVKTMFDEEVAA